VPHGVDYEKICLPAQHQANNHASGTLLPQGRSTNKRFIFLFQSAALWRKGMDVLLDAYTAEFSSHDDVLLILHSIYGDADVFAYLDEVLAKAHNNNTSPHIIRYGTRLSSTDNALLRSAANVFVMPTRAEGFGLTIAEAMACGLPVITTDQGAHMDFVNASNAILVKSKRVICHRWVSLLI
jgi:glycosyltransferase involved in cell wall biosynthesis